jgi:aryl-alcohol dehydrogenase-like predicted oxidoreductase
MADLTTRVLGRTGATVTSLGFGAMELRGGARGRKISDADVGKLLNQVLDSGITFIDTSIDYGVSEERIGQHISQRRNEYFLASKCGCQFDWQPKAGEDRGGPHIYTKDNIVAGINQSLTRLKTDHLDLVQIHATPSKAVLEENGTIETLKELQQEGKVRFLGMSGTLPNIHGHIAMGVFDAFQIPYSCSQREHEEVIAKAAEAGAGVIIRGGAAKGAPSTDNERAHSRNPDLKSVFEQAGLEDLFNGDTAMEFVMRFTATHPGMTTNIVGTINADHLKGNVAAMAKGPLPADVYDEAKRRLAPAGSAPQA